MRLSVLLDTRTNHLKLIRLVLCVMVIFSHCHPLGNFGSEEFGGFGNDRYGNLAVNCFFVISGLLISRSYARSKTPGRFLMNRFLRIFPGYWGALLVAACVIGPLVFAHDHGTLAGYGASPDSPWTYVALNLSLKIFQSGIRDLFVHNPAPSLVNGSLWTLMYEFVCYLLVLFLGYFGLLRKHSWWWLGLGALCVANMLARLDFSFPLIRIRQCGDLLHFLSYFTAGIMAHLYGEHLSIGRRGTLAAGLAFLVVGLFPLGPFPYLYHLLMPLILVPLLLGWAFWGAVPTWEMRMPDLSYGMYVYAWMVQQTLVALHLFSADFATYFAASCLFTLAFALPSYLLVEKPSLSLKKRPRSQAFAAPGD
jgi:peptidoglycan/LPS O-acetylase OafA/YrhL